MGYRSEKLIERKIIKREKKRKRFLIFLITLILIGGIYLVDKSYSEFECDGNLDSDNNVKVFAYDYEDNIHELQLFGKKYYLKEDITAKLVYNIKNKAKYLFENIKYYINK